MDANPPHPDSVTLALKVSYEVHAYGLDSLILVSPSHKPEWVWIGFANRAGVGRRQSAQGAKFIAWLNSKHHTVTSAQIELERYYNIYLQKKRTAKEAATNSTPNND